METLHATPQKDREYKPHKCLEIFSCMQQAQIRQALVESLALSLRPRDEMVSPTRANGQNSSEGTGARLAREADDRALLASHREGSRSTDADRAGSHKDMDTSSGQSTPRSRYSEDRALLSSHRGDRRSSGYPTSLSTSGYQASGGTSSPSNLTPRSRDSEDRALLSSHRGERKDASLHRSTPFLITCCLEELSIAILCHANCKYYFTPLLHPSLSSIDPLLP